MTQFIKCTIDSRETLYVNASRITRARHINDELQIVIPEAKGDATQVLKGEEARTAIRILEEMGSERVD